MKIRRTAYVALTVLSLVLGASWIYSGSLVAAQHRVVGAPPSDLAAELVSLTSNSGATISGWHVPAATNRGAIVLLHGIRASRLSMLNRARMLKGLGYSTLLIDLQAHGESTGERITIGYLEKEDVRAAVAFARSKHPNEPIGVIGVSLGGAAAVLGSPLGVDAMVIESVYSTICEAVENRVRAKLGILSDVPALLLLAQLQWRLGVPQEALRPIERIAQVRCPLLIVSGEEDVHTTASETRAMYAAAAEPKQLWLIEGAGHVDLERVNAVEYQRRVAKFFEESFAAR